MKVWCDLCTACAGVTGIAQCLPGSLVLGSVCQGCWGYTVCARVAGIGQRVQGSLGLRSMCWGCAACAGGAGVMQFVLGSCSVC